jgi:hypothetical protein
MAGFTPETVAVIRPVRQVGGFSAAVTVREIATDDLEITQHPVQEGAAITDHAYKKPVALVVELLFNDDLLPLAETYERLRALQASRIPFDVVTGKRIYKNMLFKTLGNTTDEKTENILQINATLQEIITVRVEVTTVPPRARQRMKGKTGGTQNAGTKNAKPTKRKSALRELVG